jgi:hypothetical protein
VDAPVQAGLRQLAVRGPGDARQRQTRHQRDSETCARASRDQRCAAVTLGALPGAGQALMLRQTLRGGPAMARPTIMGAATGLLIWSTAAAAGA